MLPSADRLSPAVRGTIKVGLATLFATGALALGGVVIRLLAHAGVLSADAQLPAVGYGYAVGAIALSYQSVLPHAHRAFRRRFAGTLGGMAIGIACWYLPGGTIASVVPATALGWGFGILIDGMLTADKAAYFAGATALYPADNPLASIASRTAGIFLGYLAVVIVITLIWPAEAPEERQTRFTWRRPFG
ncbi:MAG: hypothetical protein WCN97_09305 [Thermoleophilia bacterium]